MGRGFKTNAKLNYMRRLSKEERLMENHKGNSNGTRFGKNQGLQKNRSHDDYNAFMLNRSRYGCGCFFIRAGSPVTLWIWSVRPSDETDARIHQVAKICEG